MAENVQERLMLEISILRNNLSDLSKLLLDRSNTNTLDDDLSLTVQLVSMLTEGSYHKILEKTNKIFQRTESFDNVDDAINESVKEYIQGSEARELTILCVAVACLQLFVQCNWVGPLVDALPNVYLCNIETSQVRVRSELDIDGDVCCLSTKQPILLYIAKLILLDCRDSLKHCLSLNLWLLRYVHLHQSLLAERSPTLKATSLDIIQKVSEDEQIINNDVYSDLALEYHLECGHLCYFYYEPKMAATQFSAAEKLTGLEIKLTGSLGRRTRFQQKDVSQLVLEVTPLEDVNPPWSLEQGGGDTLLPTNVRLDDDTVLEQLQLADDQHQYVSPISGIQGATVLGLCYRHRRSNEMGQILQEECEAFINGVLQTPQCWSVQTKALLLRSQGEWLASRKVQRAMSQLEELVKQYKRSEPPGGQRLQHFYSVNLPPTWEIECQLAALFEKVGAIQAALEVYLRIEAWEDVIKCYVQTGKRDKADKLIREQLVVKETALLWCYLGDIHNNEEYYQKSWEFSNCRFGRAQRSLAYLHLHKKEYEKALPCFEKSLNVSGLQLGVWFSYGCAALYSDRFDLAAKAFRRCVDLGEDNFEAWNNLATAYIKSKQKPRAFLVLQEAIKCEYENWRLWENFLLVATDVGEFSEVIQAYHRLLDLRDKHTDIQVLEVLVKAITTNIEDRKGQGAKILRPKVLELFGRITSKITNNADIWRLYAELVTESDNITQMDREKAIQYLQKSHRCSIQAVNWERQTDKCLQVLQKSIHLATSYIECSKHLESDTEVCQFLAGAKLMAKGVLVNVKQKQTDVVTDELPTTIQPAYTELDNLLTQIVETINAKKN